MLAAYLAACLAGLVLLARSADALVIGASSVAARLGVPSVIVGVVVIGFGTSAPEMLVSGLAAASGSADIGFGNVVGSNIANLTLVLGVAAMTAPIVVRVEVVRREVPLALLASVLFAGALQGGLSRREGLGLIIVLALALWALVRWALAGGTQPAAVALGHEVDDLVEAPRAGSRVAVQTVGGLLGTLAGAQLLVWGAVGIASGMGLSEGFIGATVVAVGTSLPELVTAAQAARRGESDLIVGNLMGSNLFNALAVGGVIGLIQPDVVAGPEVAVTGCLLMIAVSVLALAFMVRGFRVVRWEAAVLVGTFISALPLLAAG